MGNIFSSYDGDSSDYDKHGFPLDTDKDIIFDYSKFSQPTNKKIKLVAYL